MNVWKDKSTIIMSTFDEIVNYGKRSGCEIVNGMPWCFDFMGAHLTHENDDCYLISTYYTDMTIRRGEVLVVKSYANETAKQTEYSVQNFEHFLKTHQLV